MIIFINVVYYYQMNIHSKLPSLYQNSVVCILIKSLYWGKWGNFCRLKSNLDLNRHCLVLEFSHRLRRVLYSCILQIHCTFYRYKGTTIEILKIFIDNKACSQFLRYDCHDSVISHQGKMWAHWKDRYGNKVNYWPGGEVNGYGCACGVDKTCAGDNAESKHSGSVLLILQTVYSLILCLSNKRGHLNEHERFGWLPFNV